jgi:hypothetical protein
MPPIVILQKDPFTEAEQLQADQDVVFSENANVRRPLWGLRVKDPRFAYISLYQAIGNGTTPQAISIIDSSAPGGFSQANHNFILQSVQEVRQEKVQIVETFGDAFSFFYGQKPIVLAVQGILFDTSDFNWKNEFLANYDRFLRGTKCVENKTRVFLGWDDVLAQGYLINVQTASNSEQPAVVPVSFNMLLTKPPLDLSEAAAPLDNPNPGMSEPWTYRSFEGDEFGTELPEYVSTPGDPDGGTRRTPLVAIGIDGKAVIVSGSDANVPASTESSRSASWVTGPAPGRKQWNDVAAALMKLNGYLTAQQTGADLVSVVQELRRNPSGFQFSNRDAGLLEILGSLGSGVANTAAVISDAPAVE